MADKKKTETTDEARQGSRGIPVLVILVAALLLAGIVWIIWWTIIYGGGRPEEPQPTPTVSSLYQTEEATVFEYAVADRQRARAASASLT